MILDEYAQYLSGIRNLSDKTVKTYIKTLKRINNSFDKNIEDITIEEIGIYFSENNKRVNTKRLEQTIIKSFFSWYSEKYKRYNPAKDLRVQTKEEISPMIITIDEVVKMIKYVGMNDFISLQESAILCFLADTGVRVSELINVKLGHIEEANDHLIVLITGGKNTKTYVQRQIPFCKFKERSIIAEYFLAYYQTIKYVYKYNNENYLFQPIRNDNGQYKRISIYTLIKTIAKGTGITKKISPHSFRHFYATYSIINGMRLPVLQKRLGHKKIDTTMRYIHLADLYGKEQLEHNPLMQIKAPEEIRGFVKNMKEIIKKKERHNEIGNK